MRVPPNIRVQRTRSLALFDPSPLTRRCQHRSGRIGRVRVHGAAQASRPWADIVRGAVEHVDLKLVSRLEFDSGAVAMRYQPRG